MISIRCQTCGATAEISPNLNDYPRTFVLSMQGDFPDKCHHAANQPPLLSESGGDWDCPDLEKAIAAELDRQQKQSSQPSE